jgi:TatD DNase family protein
MDVFSRNRKEILERAREKGVATMLLVGLSPDDSRVAIFMAMENKELFAAVGIHPIDSDTYETSDVLAMADFAKNNKVIAIGETGIDLHRNPHTFEKQKEMFRAHIKLARTVKLPLIIHDREAHESVISLLDKEDGWSVGGVIHCFSGDLDMALYAIQKGFFISVPGSITYKGATAMREIIKGIPLTSLLIETDAPFLSPEPYRGKKNEPAFIIETLKMLATIKEVSLDEMAAVTTQNFERLFFKGTPLGKILSNTNKKDNA